MKKGNKFISKKTIKELNFFKGKSYEYQGSIGNTIYFTNVDTNKWIPLGINFNEFFEFFYTEKEVRKLKLNEINERKIENNKKIQKRFKA